MSQEPRKRFLTRRSFLAVPPALFLTACRFASGGKVDKTVHGFQRFTDWVQQAVFDSDKLAPEYSDDHLTPEDGFRVNGYDTDEPDMDIPHWTLAVDGLVKTPREYSLAE